MKVTRNGNIKIEVNPESILDSIPKLWVARNLFYRNKKGQIKPFPKPEIEE